MKIDVENKRFIINVNELKTFINRYDTKDKSTYKQNALSTVRYIEATNEISYNQYRWLIKKAVYAMKRARVKNAYKITDDFVMCLMSTDNKLIKYKEIKYDE